MKLHWTVVANVHGDRVLRDGAKVYLVHIPGWPDNCRANGLSKGGRRIEKYVRVWTLTNIRAGYAPDSQKGLYETKDEAAQVASKLEAWRARRVAERMANARGRAGQAENGSARKP